jgi:hypothetical protein
VDHEDVRLHRDERDRREVALRVVGEALVELGVEREADVAEEQGVTVGRRFRDDLGAERAAGAAAAIRPANLLLETN